MPAVDIINTVVSFLVKNDIHSIKGAITQLDHVQAALLYSCPLNNWFSLVRVSFQCIMTCKTSFNKCTCFYNVYVYSYVCMYKSTWVQL